MEARKLRYQFYVIRGLSREDCIRRAVERIKADPLGFVIDAELIEPKRSLLGRFFLG
jgi:hypothetical protein